jgi:hypothetical protein
VKRFTAENTENAEPVGRVLNLTAPDAEHGWAKSADLLFSDQNTENAERNNGFSSVFSAVSAVKETKGECRV